MSVLQYKFFHITENILFLSNNFELKFFCLFLICSQLFYTFCRRSFWHCDLFFKGNISPFRKSTTYFLQILTFRIKWVEHLIVSLTSYGKYSEILEIENLVHFSLNYSAVNFCFKKGLFMV